MHVAGTTPYPWPYDGRLGEAGTALLVVDRSGAATGGAARAAVAALAGAATAAGAPVIRVTTTLPAGVRRRGAGTDPFTGTGAADGADAAWTNLVTHHLTAHGVDAFYGSDLELVLTGARIRRLVLAGSPLEAEVHSTMRAANDRGYEVLLVVDACTPADPALAAASRGMVETSGGIFGAVGQTADVVAAWSAANGATATTSEAASPALAATSSTAPKEH